MTWSELATAFHLTSAAELVRGGRIERYQSWRARARWFDETTPPLCVLLISHRWETPTDPDPNGRQFRALVKFIALVARCVSACLVSPSEREAVVPSLDSEGTLQALSVAARILDREPLEPAYIDPMQRAHEVTAKAAELGATSDAFAHWLASRIAVWIDHACVPQAPRTDLETEELRATLRRLPELMGATTLVALRYRGDGYETSGWCTTESFVGSRGPTGRGFARNLFLEIDALLGGGPLYLPRGLQTATRPDSEEAAVLGESYALASRAFADARERLLADPLPWIKSSPPRIWSDYVGLLSDSYHPAEVDPSPTRHALELMIRVGEAMVQRWLFAEQIVELDLEQLANDMFARASLRCTAAEDCTYLALFLMATSKWTALRPLFRDALAAWTSRMGDGAMRSLRVRLQPQPAARTLMRTLPGSAGVWSSRLSTGAMRTDERNVVDAVQRELDQNPPRYELL